MVLLAIDTSEAACSVALIDNQVILAQRSEEIGRGHAERLLPLIDAILIDGKTSLSDITRFAVTTGPGTFTGLRIGLSVARGLALPADLPCIGLSGLTVLAAQAFAALGSTDTIVHAVITGRAGQAFHQCFGGETLDGLPHPVASAQGLDAAEIAGMIRQEPGFVIGSGRGLLAEQRFADVLDIKSGMGDIQTIDAGMLGLLSGSLNPALYVPDPLYLRAADAKKAVPVLPIGGK
jgi:tRNA threonylcarbamoyladenosine biosynthesis protein TsaB